MSLSIMHHLKSFRYFTQKINLCLRNQNFPVVVNTNFKPFLKPFSPSIMIVAEKKSIAEELGLPELPKKPATPYIRYVKEEIKKYSDMKQKDKIMKIAEIWNSLGESAKLKYFKEYNTELENYKQKLTQYTARLTAEQIQEIKNLKVKRRVEKKESENKKMLRKTRDSLGKPKHPGNIFTLFIEKIKKEGNIPKEYKLLLYARDKWHNLSEEEKNYYKEESRKLLLKYKEDFLKWETKMVESGRSDLVRPPTLAASVSSSEKKK